MNSRVISEKFFRTQTLKDLLENHLRSLSVIDDAEEVVDFYLNVKQQYTAFTIKVQSNGKNTVQSVLTPKRKKRIIFDDS